MLINLRNALMAGRRLPYDAEVEFLQSTRTEWIDTGLLGRDGYDFEYRFRPMRPLPCGIGGEYEDNKNCYIGLVRSNGNLAYNYFTPNVITEVQSLALGTDYTVKAHLHSGEQYFEVNGVRGGIGSKAGSFVSNFSLYVFAINSNNQPVFNANMRLYSLKIYLNGTLVRDFIPVRKGTVGYLYDRVSGKLFGNAGTGDFVLGPDVVPVEYIESHGTEYIDTGVIATNSHGFRVDVATVQKSGATNTRIFGVHEGNTRCGFALYGRAEVSGNDFFWGWNAATGFVADIPQRFVASLNYKNDRAAIFDGTTNLSSLGTLGNTTKSIYLLNANYNGTPFSGQYVIGKLYGVEVSVGSSITNRYKPVRVGTEGAMMDVLTRRIYRNAGTGAFGYGNDLKYPIPAE